MSTVKLGKTYRLKVGNGASPEVFTSVGGEGTLQFKGSSDTIDTSSKDDGNYKSKAFGGADVTITAGGVLKLPDVGLNALDTASKGGVPINVELVDGVTVMFAASVWVGNRSLSLDDNQAVKWSFDLSLNGAPSIDAFFPAS